MISSIQKTGVVEDTAHIQSPFKFLDLLLCRVKTIFIGFGFQYSVSSPQVLPVQSMQEKQSMEKSPFIPSLTEGDFSARKLKDNNFIAIYFNRGKKGHKFQISFLSEVRFQQK